MRIVVRLSHSRVTVAHPNPFREVRTELTSVIGLYTLKQERCRHLCLFDELRSGSRIRLRVHPGVCPPAIDIDTGEHIEDGLSLYREVHGIGLY